MKGNQKNTNQEIAKIEQKRQERRKNMEEAKRIKQQRKQYNDARGKNVDIDFEIMIEKNKFKEKILSEHTSSSDLKLAVCVRKRPIFKKQQQSGEIDSISCANPQIKIHEPKYKVDGITKYIENHTFTFDNTFNEEQSTQQIYTSSLRPLIPLLIKNGILTCFAYGQTGSGKTFTMNALQELVVKEMFEMIKKNYSVSISFFEIYGGRCLDLLNEKNSVNIMEDGSGNIQIQQLTEKLCGSAKELLQIMSVANASRTTHATVANDTSSRSHAICQVFVKKGSEDVGKLVLVDLAGSERAQDTQSNNRQRRMQGAQINKSLLALKECIRAMGDKADHVPFRASKLTLILRDSFISKVQKSKVVMIACISPGSSSADHSLNTLRYADRLKDNKEQHEMFNKMVEEMNRKNENLEKNLQIEKEHLQKIGSAKNIRKDEKKQESRNTPQNQKASINPGNKPPPKSNIPSIPNIPNLPSIKKKDERKEQQRERQRERQKERQREKQKKQEKDKRVNRVVSVKKTPVSNKSTTNNSSSTPKKGQLQENQIQEQITIEQQEGKGEKKKKVKDDVNLMKQTMTNANKEEYFAFQEKVADILEQQQEVFATHMAAIKEDAKLLTQESELISKVQGVGYVDYDVDSYVDKLEQVIKKKLKIYSILSKKLDKFKGALKEEDQIRHKVKDTFYY